MAPTLQKLYGTAEHHGQYGVLIHDPYADVRLFHALLRRDFPSRWLQLLQWPLVALLNVPDLVESVTELTTFRNFLLPSYTSCSDRHASLYWSSVRWWISMGFTLSLRKNKWQNAVPLLCMLQVGPPSLHYCCAVMLLSSIVLPPIGHSSNHEYHCCQLTGQSSGVLNFYHTFKIFIWLTFIIYAHKLCSRYSWTECWPQYFTFLSVGTFKNPGVFTFSRNWTDTLPTHILCLSTHTLIQGEELLS